MLRSAGARRRPRPAAAATPQRAFGVYVDPWHVDELGAAASARAPQYVARFEAFSRGTTVDAFLRESERQGIRRVLVSWEPWRPVPAELGVAEQFRPQPGYRNVDIAARRAGRLHPRFARSLATFHGRVDLRYAHEMNGTWYPWSHDPVAYRRAWRRIVRLVPLAGARNVRFVWSVNPSLYVSYRPLAAQRARLLARAPVRGRGRLDDDQLRRRQALPVARFAPRLRTLRRLYRKPVLLTEVSTARRGRVRWLHLAARGMLRRTPWIRSVAWFQHRSRGQAQIEGTGRLDWDVPGPTGRRRDPARHHPRRAAIAGPEHQGDRHEDRGPDGTDHDPHEPARAPSASNAWR